MTDARTWISLDATSRAGTGTKQLARAVFDVRHVFVSKDGRVQISDPVKPRWLTDAEVEILVKGLLEGPHKLTQIP